MGLLAKNANPKARSSPIINENNDSEQRHYSLYRAINFLPGVICLLICHLVLWQPSCACVCVYFLIGIYVCWEFHMEPSNDKICSIFPAQATNPWNDICCLSSGDNTSLGVVTIKELLLSKMFVKGHATISFCEQTMIQREEQPPWYSARAVWLLSASSDQAQPTELNPTIFTILPTTKV